MAKLITVVAMVAAGIWFANVAVDGVLSSHAAHAERTAAASNTGVRGQ